MRRPWLVAALLALAGCRAELASDLDEMQADEIVLALDAAGIAAEKQSAGATPNSGRFRVLVAREDVAAGLAVLRDVGLPRERAPGFAELFAERGLVPSAAEERARYASATAGELARSIESFEGVTRARVHIALSETGTLDDSRTGRPRASVLIEHRRGARIDETAIQALVAGAVPDLSGEDVAVIRAETQTKHSPEPQLVMLGPIAVTRASAGMLKALLAASFATNLVLAVALVLSRARRRTFGEHGPEHRPPTAPPRTD